MRSAASRINSSSELVRLYFTGTSSHLLDTLFFTDSSFSCLNVLHLIVSQINGFDLVHKMRTNHLQLVSSGWSHLSRIVQLSLMSNMNIATVLPCRISHCFILWSRSRWALVLIEDFWLNPWRWMWPSTTTSTYVAGAIVDPSKMFCIWEGANHLCRITTHNLNRHCWKLKREERASETSKDAIADCDFIPDWSILCWCIATVLRFTLSSLEREPQCSLLVLGASHSLSLNTSLPKSIFVNTSLFLPTSGPRKISLLFSWHEDCLCSYRYSLKIR